ncbi:MAG: OmpH family outer membrane protein [Planctomycetaceae bacterium]|nr:OmpH family outer membrane protein [Planctomycetaceae bacterium]
MRLSFQSAAAAAILVTLCGLSATALGQAPPAAARPAPAAPATAGAELAGTRVAVIDIALIFKHHDRFNGQMNDIKRDIEQFEAYVRDQQKTMKSRHDELQNYNATSPEYKSREADLARTQADLQLKIGMERKNFLEREARVYYQIYKEIEASVKTFAQRARIGLVLRFNSDDMKEDDRASVLQGVNRAVVYHQGLDITAYIIEDLNRRPFNPNEKPAGPGLPTVGAPAPGATTQPPPRTATGPASRPIVPGGTR